MWISTNKKLVIKPEDEYIPLNLIKELTVSTPIGVEMMRLGSLSDGGYVFANDLTNNDLFISAGIGNNYSVDAEVVDLVGHLVMVDHTIPKIDLLKDNQEHIRLPLSPQDTSGGISLKQICKDHPTKDCILKMDIEGDEWDILLHLDEKDLLRFRQIVVEVHDITDTENIENYEKRLMVFKKLNLTHNLVCLNGNNYATYADIANKIIPCVLELTWLRKTSYSFKEGFDSTTKDLLYKNDPNSPPLVLTWV